MTLGGAFVVAEGKVWETYEEVAVFLLGEMAAEFGLERVERKQHVDGSITSWEIDGKGVKIGGEGFLIIECRRYSRSKQDQGKASSLAYSIHDIGASGGILVSPLGLQKGAKKIAEAENIHEVLLNENSTTTDYVLRFLNKVFVGVSDTIRITDSVTVVKTGPDGTTETLTA